MPKLYVDYDGTLVDDRVDKIFNHVATKIGRERALSWYESSTIWKTKLTLNLKVLLGILYYKSLGYSIVMFTNRFPVQLENISNNLGAWSTLFDEYIFGSGQKSKIMVEGALWDNDPKFEKCCPTDQFVLIPTFKGGNVVEA